MSDGTHIQWATASVNPIRARGREDGKQGWFCTRVSPACTNCYASDMNQNRYYGTGHEYIVGNLPKVEPYIEPRVLEQVIRWRKPREIFWCSMTDLFGEFVPDAWIDQVLTTIALTPHHRHIILTKRVERAAEHLLDGSWDSDEPQEIRHRVYRLADRHACDLNLGEGHPSADYLLSAHDAGWPLSNVIIGASVENQEWADKRRPAMAAISDLGWPTWISNEPGLGPIDWSGWEFLNWMVSGGESGSRAKVRPYQLEWARQSRDWCRENDVPWFLKQIGTRPTVRCEENPRLWPDKLAWDVDGRGPSTRWAVKVRHHKGGDMGEWSPDLRVRQLWEVTP